MLKLLLKILTVLERCKSAVDLISDLEQNKLKVPLTCAIPNQNLQQPNVTDNRSPLLTSESNPQFLFQATPNRCYSVLENHPLRNIYGKTAEVAQYLKFDLHDLSSNVARESISRQRNNEDPVMAASTSGINNNNNNVNKKSSTKEVQTDTLTCRKCHQTEIVKQSARNKPCQTDNVSLVDSEVQCDEQDENAGFRVFIDAQTMLDRNFEQHHALEVFSRAFGIPCPFLENDRVHERVEERRPVPEERDDRWNFTNPEPPHIDTENPAFFSISPIRTNSSPKRFKNSNSPPPRFRTSNSPPRARQARSVFERIGGKISEHSDSPRNYDDWNDDYNDRPPFRPYRIPSPQYDARERSSERSRRYRNKSRSRSLSRSRSRSPKRYRGAVLNRRGRY